MLKKIYLKIFPSYIAELDKELKDCKKILDLGCGDSSPLQYTSFRGYSRGIDIFKPSIKISKKKRIHNDYALMDVFDIKRYKGKEYDCILALDLIEHLTKKEGRKLIKLMEEVSTKKVIIFTPNGFVHQGKYKKNPYQVHKSGWNVEEMRKLGYKVVGIYGWKKLRGNFSEIKYRPKIFWRIISDITQKYTRNHPEKAYALLCVKEKKLAEVNRKFKENEE